METRCTTWLCQSLMYKTKRYSIIQYIRPCYLEKKVSLYVSIGKTQKDQVHISHREWKEGIPEDQMGSHFP